MNKATLDALKLILKSWWKVLIIIIGAGIVIAGFSFRIGPFACDKQGIKLEEAVEKK